MLSCVPLRCVLFGFFSRDCGAQLFLVGPVTMGEKNLLLLRPVAPQCASFWCRCRRTAWAWPHSCLVACRFVHTRLRVFVLSSGGAGDGGRERRGGQQGGEVFSRLFSSRRTPLLLRASQLPVLARAFLFCLPTVVSLFFSFIFCFCFRPLRTLPFPLYCSSQL